MSTITTHAPGTTCWAELGTTDSAAARVFYQALFGWNANEISMDWATYTLLQQNGRDVGGLYDLQDEQRAQGVPPHWMLYTAVEDVDATVEKARANGGSVVAEPMDIPNVGRIAVLSDPEGATFAVMQPGDHPGFGAKDEPGALCWTELSARDVEGATAFYGALFGWVARTDEMPDGPYTTLSHGGADVGGILQITDEWGDVPSAWMPYFGVADLDAALEVVRERGGSVMMGPMEAKGVGRLAFAQDPQGAFLSIIQLDAFE